MSHPLAQTPLCGSCGAYLQPPNNMCPVCNTQQWPAPPLPQAPPPPMHTPMYQPVPVVPYGVVVPAKSQGVAILLSVLWLGAGNLYAGQTALGVVFLVLNIPLVLFSMTIIGLVVTFPIWLIVMIISIVTAAQGATDFNRRNGIYVR